MGAYRLVTTWRLQAPPQAVWEALRDAEAYPQWWPGFERVEVLEDGDPDGVGRRARVTMRGRLPYRLRFDIVGREVREPDRIVVEATGQLVGSGRWEMEHDGEVTTTTYAWDVATTSRWMKVLEPFARPAFIVNHHVAMRGGAEGLARHLGGRLLSEESLPRVRVRDWAPTAGLVAGLVGLGAWRRLARVVPARHHGRS